MKLKRILCGGVIVCMLVLTACGSSSSSGTDTSDSENTEDIEMFDESDVSSNESDNETEEDDEEAFYWATEEEEQEDVVVNSFTCEPSEIPINSEEKIIFKADITNNTGMLLTSTNVFVVADDGAILGYMNDDGADGDEVAGDSIWTLEGTCSSDEEGELICHIMVNNIMSTKEAVLKVN